MKTRMRKYRRNKRTRRQKRRGGTTEVHLLESQNKALSDYRLDSSPYKSA